MQIAASANRRGSVAANRQQDVAMPCAIDAMPHTGRRITNARPDIAASDHERRDGVARSAAERAASRRSRPRANCAESRACGARSIAAPSAPHSVRNAPASACQPASPMSHGAAARRARRRPRPRSRAAPRGSAFQRARLARASSSRRPRPRGSDAHELVRRRDRDEPAPRVPVALHERRVAHDGGVHAGDDARRSARAMRTSRPPPESVATSSPRAHRRARRAAARPR